MSSVLSSDVLIIALRVLVLLIVRYVSSLACFINFRPCIGLGSLQPCLSRRFLSSSDLVGLLVVLVVVCVSHARLAKVLH